MIPASGLPHETDTSHADISKVCAPNICAIIVAAGSGNRARGKLDPDDAAPKQFQALAGRPLVAWSLQALGRHPAVETIILVLPDDGRADDETRIEPWRAFVPASTRLLAATGGATRRDSVRHGLERLDREGLLPATAHVLVHDGARPFVDTALIDRLLAAVNTAPGAVPCLAVTDTLKRRLVGDALAAGPDRSSLVSVQTPQAFSARLLLDAHRAVEEAAATQAFTDDASVMEWAGHTCVGVDGDTANIKITTPSDWARARDILAKRDLQDNNGTPMTRTETRTGHGYDVHRLVPGDAVILCGHAIPHTHRLDGHSDADVGLHALTDALLGALCEGDIGTHFPPSDPLWKGAASHLFAAHAARRVRARGGRIVHVDVTLVAEAPKVGPHRAAMQAAIASCLDIGRDRISIKATTNEKMGFTGREEGIAALATATVELPVDGVRPDE